MTTIDPAIEYSAARLSAKVMACPVFPQPRAFDAFAPTPAQMTDVARWFGLDCHACRNDPKFTARLIDTTIYYNGLAQPRRQALYIWHEIIEYLARKGSPELFEQDECGDATIANAEDPQNIRHQIARSAESFLIDAFPELDPKAGAKRQIALQESIDTWFASHSPDLPIIAVNEDGVDTVYSEATVG